MTFPMFYAQFGNTPGQGLTGIVVCLVILVVLTCLALLHEAAEERRRLREVLAENRKRRAQAARDKMPAGEAD